MLVLLRAFFDLERKIDSICSSSVRINDYNFNLHNKHLGCVKFMHVLNTTWVMLSISILTHTQWCRNKLIVGGRPYWTCIFIRI